MQPYRAKIPDAHHSVVVFDDERGRYLVLDLGWSGDQYLYTTLIHVDLIGEQVWIQRNDTEDGSAVKLQGVGEGLLVGDGEAVHGG